MEIISILNRYLAKGILPERTKNGKNYTEDDLISWTYCLHSALHCNVSNVSNGTIVYRGSIKAPPSTWIPGIVFRLPCFVSTSKRIEIAVNFSAGEEGYLFIIKILNNNNWHYYCRDISKESDYAEDEVLITVLCQYRVEEIDGHIIKLTCLGY